MIPDTQRAAWESLSKDLPDRRAQVFAVIRQEGLGIALWRIAERLRWPINCVSGRVTELKRLGLVWPVGKQRNPGTGKYATLWGTKTFDGSGQGWLV